MQNGQQWPRITIVTPSFNQAEYLEECLRSVVLQRYPNLQHIVLDGGSNDASVGIIKHYLPWLSHWESRPDKGQADAIARGFDIGEGSIFGWLNSDDVYAPNALTRVAEFFTDNSDCAVVTGGCLRIDESGHAIKSRFGVPRYHHPEVQTPRKLRLIGFGYNQMATFWTAEAYRRAGGLDRSMIYCFDLDLVYRLCTISPGRILDEPLACFREHSATKTATLEHVHDKEREEVLSRYAAGWMADPEDPRWVRQCLRAVRRERRVDAIAHLLRLKRLPTRVADLGKS